MGLGWVETRETFEREKIFSSVKFVYRSTVTFWVPKVIVTKIVNENPIKSLGDGFCGFTF